MRMILHILLKDLRRHWPEICGFILVTAGWARQSAHPDPWIQHHGAATFPILAFVLLFLLIVRVVQGESLVGDREFWQTRPYCWLHLFLAKALLLIVVLNGTVSIAHIYLLVDAGIPFSASWIAGILWLQFQYDVYFLLPAIAFAAVTATIVQWVLTLIGIGIIYFLISCLPWYRLQQSLPSTEDLASILGVTVVACILLVLVIWQYARRNAWRSRIIAAVAVLIAPVWVVVATIPVARNVAYPKEHGDPLHLAIDTDGGGPHYQRVHAFQSSTIYLPLKATGLSDDAIVVIEGFRIHLTGDGGWKWDSNWTNQNLTFSPDSKERDLNFELTDDIANALQSLHVTASIELAAAVYQLAPAQELQTTTEHFGLPGGAVCTWLEWGSLDCVAALRNPDVLVVRISSDSNTCDRTLPRGHFAIQTEFDESPFPADFNLNPVKKVFSYFGKAWVPAIPDRNNPNQFLAANWCRGTPFDVRTGKFVRRMQIKTALGSIGSETKRIETHEDEQVFHFKPMAE
jgi:hypothetical protein